MGTTLFDTEICVSIVFNSKNHFIKWTLTDFLFLSVWIAAPCLWCRTWIKSWTLSLILLDLGLGRPGQGGHECSMPHWILLSTVKAINIVSNSYCKRLKLVYIKPVKSTNWDFVTRDNQHLKCFFFLCVLFC